jgi:hypothetical protein
MADSLDRRQRDYNYLVSRLKIKQIKINKNLFVSVLNSISNIEELGFTKEKAISLALRDGVTKKSVKEVLKGIEYLTPHQAKRMYNTKGYYEAKALKDKIKKD